MKKRILKKFNVIIKQNSKINLIPYHNKLLRKRFPFMLIPIILLFISLFSLVKMYNSDSLFLSGTKTLIAFTGIGLFFLIDFFIDLFFYKKYNLIFTGFLPTIKVISKTDAKLLFKFKKLKLFLGFIILGFVLIILLRRFL